MFSSRISRTSACARSTLSKILRDPSLSHQWHALPTARHLSTKRALASPTTSKLLHLRTLTTSYCRHNVDPKLGTNAASKPVGAPGLSVEPELGTTTAALAQIEGEPSYQENPKMAIAFTCTVPDCGHRQAHVFSKRSYERGIVIITCSSCKNRHLIADNLGWFENLTGDRAHVTIEKLAQAQGEKVTRGVVGEDGVLEFFDEAPQAISNSEEELSRS